MEYNKLLYVAIFHPNESVRVAAGERLVAIAEQRGAFALKLISGNEDLHQITRMQAGKLAVQKAIVEGDFEFVLSLSKSKDVLKEVVDYAKMHLERSATAFCDACMENRQYGKIERWAADESVPENIRLKMCNLLIEEYVESDNASALIELSGNEDLPMDARENAGKTGVRIIAEKGDLEWSIALSKSQDVPECVRKFAKEKIKNAVENTVKNAFEQGGFFHLERWLKKDLSHDIKEKIGDAMINELISYGIEDLMVKLAGNADLSDVIRERAGRIAVDYACNKSDLEQMLAISNSKDLNKNVREYAKKKIEVVAVSIIGKFINDKDGSLIEKYARFANVPEHVRVAFGTAIIEHKMECRDMCGLIEIGGDQDLPMCLRELACKKALEIAHEKNDVLAVIRMIKSRDLPKSALDASVRMMREIAKKVRNKEIDDNELQEMYIRSAETFAARATVYASEFGLEEDKGILLKPDAKFTRRNKNAANKKAEKSKRQIW